MLGAGIARPLLDRTGCTDPLARGIAAATSAHGMATGAATEMLALGLLQPRDGTAAAPQWHNIMSLLPQLANDLCSHSIFQRRAGPGGTESAAVTTGP